MNLFLIPGAKLSAHQGTWTGGIAGNKKHMTDLIGEVVNRENLFIQGTDSLPTCKKGVEQVLMA